MWIIVTDVEDGKKKLINVDKILGIEEKGEGAVIKHWNDDPENQTRPSKDLTVTENLDALQKKLDTRPGGC